MLTDVAIYGGTTMFAALRNLIAFWMLAALMLRSMSLLGEENVPGDVPELGEDVCPITEDSLDTSDFPES